MEEFRIEGAEREEDNGSPEREGKMHLVHDCVGARQIRIHCGNGRSFIEGESLVAQKPCRSLVEAPVRESYGLVDAACCPGGMYDQSGLVVAAGLADDRGRFVTLEQIVHEKNAAHIPELSVVDVAVKLQPPVGKSALYRNMHDNDPAEAEALFLSGQPVKDLRAELQIAEDQIGDRFLLKHISPSFLILKIQKVQHGHGGPGHIQSVEGENGIRRHLRQDTDSRVIGAGHLQRGKNLGVPFPHAKHLPVAVLLSAFDQGGGIQTFFAV